METWIQNYTAVGGSLYLTAAVALLPIIFFFVALTVLKLKGYQAGLYTLLIALGVAVLGFGMPAGMAVSSALYGFAYGLWPIAWIIVTAVFLYKITVKTGQFDIIRASVISITEDQRLQMLLVGFSFGAFLEGAAGFGAPVAITASLEGSGWTSGRGSGIHSDVPARYASTGSSASTPTASAGSVSSWTATSSRPSRMPSGGEDANRAARTAQEFTWGPPG